MATTSEVMGRMEQKLDGLVNRVTVMEKSFTAHGDKDDQQHQIVKALMGGARPGGMRYAVVGGDGASTDVDIMSVMSGARQKSLGRGFGKDLQAIAIARGAIGDPASIGWGGECVYKHLQNRKFGAVTKGGLAEAGGSTGGYTLAPQYYMDLIRAAVEKAAVRPRCMTIPMTSRTLYIPGLRQDFTTLAAGQSAYLGGLQVFWGAEASTIQPTQPQFRQIEMNARDMMFLTVASNDLLQDNAISLDAFLTTLFTEAIAWAYDYYILRGNGANQPMGLLNNPAAYTYSRASAGVFAMADAAGMYARLLTQSVDSACWIMHPSVMYSLITMTNGASNSGFLVFLNPAPYSGEGGPMAQKMPLTFFMGLPVIWTEKLPSLASGSLGSVILADLSKQIVGDRLQLQIESSIYPLFSTNQTMWRCIARWDSQNSLNSPIITEAGTSSGYQMACIVQLQA